MQDRVVITGMGTVNSLGLSTAESWRNAVEGNSGVGSITLFDASSFPVQVAAEVKGFHPESVIPAKEVRRTDRFEQLAMAAAKEAICQAGLEIGEGESNRVGVILSSAIGGIKSLQDAVITLVQEGPRRISPFLIPMLMANGASGMIAIEHNLRGPSFSVASACASGSDGIGTAWMMIRSGMIDVALTGASEATITPVGIGAFDRTGAMSRRNDNTSPRPFDRERDGLVMGEGAAVLILERESRARRRGAVILAELAGYGATADAFHVTAPAEHGEGGAQAMLLALNAAGVNPSQVDYINAHGTGTVLNDLAETRAIKAAFRERAYHVPVSSTKSMTGHMMGATCALEAIFCVQTIREGVIPPTINYSQPDPECDLDYVPNQARTMPVRLVISNAFGFGGHNSVLVIRSYN